MLEIYIVFGALILVFMIRIFAKDDKKIVEDAPKNSNIEPNKCYTIKLNTGAVYYGNISNCYKHDEEYFYIRDYLGSSYGNTITVRSGDVVFHKEGDFTEIITKSEEINKRDVSLNKYKVSVLLSSGDSLTFDFDEFIDIQPSSYSRDVYSYVYDISNLSRLFNGQNYSTTINIPNTNLQINPNHVMTFNAELVEKDFKKETIFNTRVTSTRVLKEGV